jgi:hypothetical protein
MRCSLPVPVALLCFAATLFPAAVNGQEDAFHWRVITTPGYAAGGMAAAAIPAYAANSIETGVLAFGAGIAGGLIAGYLIGNAAEEKLERGEELSGGHKNLVRAGTVLMGAGVGAIGSFFIINADDGSDQGFEEEPSVSDETIFASFVAGGAAVGVVTQILLESRLRPALASRAEIGVVPGPEPAVVLRVEL